MERREIGTYSKLGKDVLYLCLSFADQKGVYFLGEGNMKGRLVYVFIIVILFVFSIVFVCLFVHFSFFFFKVANDKKNSKSPQCMK